MGNLNPMTREHLEMGDDARGFFKENGYYLARGVYSPREICLLREEFDRIVHQVTESGGPGAGPNAAEDNGIVSTYNVQKYSAYWLTHGLLHRPFLDLAEQFIGSASCSERACTKREKPMSSVRSECTRTGFTDRWRRTPWSRG